MSIDAMLDRVDGVLVTGARSNVHPSNYGAEATLRRPDGYVAPHNGDGAAADGFAPAQVP